jgi:protein TonB
MLIAASSGSSRGVAGVARGGSAADHPIAGASDGASDRSGGVSLADQDWACPWPREADAEQINDETVVIQVVVGVTGRAESVTVLSDPGHGFGQAAIACALRTRFTPGRDRDGRAIRASSPPILVRFTR